MYDVLVIGAGFAGAVFAREMADAGKKVLVIEKRQQVGGNAYDESIENILVQKYGPHIFHTNNKKVVDFLKRFSDWYPYEHHVLARVQEKLVPVPFNFTSIDMLFSEEEAAALKEELLHQFEENKRISVFDLMDHESVSINRLGEFIYENIFLNYTAKQWGMPSEMVDKSTLNRVPVIVGYDSKYFQDTYQVMPQNGFTAVFENILDHKNIDLKLNTNAREIINFETNAEKITFKDKEFSGTVFFTGAIDEFLNYKYGLLPYRSLNMQFEDLDCEWYQPNSVVNYPNEEDFTRITEFKYFTPPNTLKTIILKEYPFQHDPESEPYYPVINSANDQVYQKYRDFLRRAPNFILCGRLAEYKYYNMDAVVERSLFYADQAKGGKKQSRKIFIKEMVLYGFIGLASAGIDSGIFFMLRKLGINLYFSNFIGINIGICCSFFLNTFINFRVKDNLLKRAVKFWLVGYCGLLLSMLIMFLGVEALHYRDAFVKLLSIIIVAGLQFLFNKFITFKAARSGVNG